MLIEMSLVVRPELKTGEVGFKIEKPEEEVAIQCLSQSLHLFPIAALRWGQIDGIEPVNVVTANLRPNLAFVPPPHGSPAVFAIVPQPGDFVDQCLTNALLKKAWDDGVTVFRELIRDSGKIG